MASGTASASRCRPTTAREVAVAAFRRDGDARPLPVDDAGRARASGARAAARRPRRPRVERTRLAGGHFRRRSRIRGDAAARPKEPSLALLQLMFVYVATTDAVPAAPRLGQLRRSARGARAAGRGAVDSRRRRCGAPSPPCSRSRRWLKKLPVRGYELDRCRPRRRRQRRLRRPRAAPAGHASTRTASATDPTSTTPSRATTASCSAHRLRRRAARSTSPAPSACVVAGRSLRSPPTAQLGRPNRRSEIELIPQLNVASTGAWSDGFCPLRASRSIQQASQRRASGSVAKM